MTRWLAHTCPIEALQVIALYFSEFGGVGFVKPYFGHEVTAFLDGAGLG